MPNLNLKVSKRARFWIRMITTCQFLKNKVHKVPVLERKSTRRVKFWLESFTVSNFDLGFPQPVRLWTSRFTMWQILWEKSHNMSFSELQVIQLVGFWVEKSTTCQSLSQKLYKVSDFVSWSSKRVSFWVENYKKCQILEKVVFKFHVDHFVPQNRHVLPSACFFKGILLKKKTVCILSDLSWTKSERVRFWFKSFTTCKILKWKFYNVSNFNLKVSPRIIIWNKIIRIFRDVK